MKIVKIPKLGDELEMVPFEVKEEGVYVKYYPEGVQAGFPSPAEDFTESKLSLDKRYLCKPETTFIVRVKGDSMYPTLNVGDILVVRSDLNLEDDNIAIISVNNTDFTAKRFDKANEVLIADNPDFPNIKLHEEDTLICKGVVKHLIRDL